MRFRIRLRAGLLLVLLGLGTSVAPAAVSNPITVTVNFEDVFGFCADNFHAQGPGDFSTQGVSFDSPDILCFNNGRFFPYNTPFQSDWLGIFTYGPGLRVTFPDAITSLSFETGYVGNLQTPGTFRLEAGGQFLVQFTPVATPAPPIQVNFQSPVTEVFFKFVDGSSSFMGIDTMTFTTVPEPSSWASILASTTLFLRRGARRA